MRLKDWLWLLIVFILALISAEAYFVVPEGQFAVARTYTRTQYDAPGLHFKWPFLTQLTWLEIKEQQQAVTLPNLTSSEGVTFSAAVLVNWRISDPKQFFSLDQTKPFATALTDSVLALGPTVLAAKPFTTVLTTQSGLEANLQANLSQKLSPYGITITQVTLNNINLSGNSLTSAYGAMKTLASNLATLITAQNQAQAAALTQAANDQLLGVLKTAYARAAKTVAEGQTEALAIMAPLYHQNPDFFNDFISVETHTPNQQ